MQIISRTHRAASVAMIFLGFCYLVLYPKQVLFNQYGWIWDTPGRNFAMEHMLIAVYGCMGLFLMYGARDPVRFLPFIDFVIVSGILHATAMLIDALRIPGEEEHLMLRGDVIGMYWGPLLLMIFHPRKLYLGGLFGRAA